MKMLLAVSCVLTLLLTSGLATAKTPGVQASAMAVHACATNPFLRASGLFGGPQPQIFLAGSDVRREAPPAADAAVRVFNASDAEDLQDPDARPVIDKCGSWLQAVGEGDVKVTILWRDRNCRDAFEFDEEDTNDCRARQSFRFRVADLGGSEGDPRDGDGAIVSGGKLLVDAYFVQQIRPERRHPETGLIIPEQGVMRLVVRLLRAPTESISERRHAPATIRFPPSLSAARLDTSDPTPA